MSLRTHATESINKMIKTIKNDQAILEQDLEKEKIKRKIEILKNAINSIITISPEEIEIKNNVRYKIDENSLDFIKLCESIKKFGLMKNIVAELQISDQQDSYKLVCIAGHRRLTALKHLGFKNKIPCLIKQYNNSDRVGAALSENLTREGLNCVDIANGYKELTNTGWTNDDLVKHFERSKNTIQQYLRIANLADDIKDSIRNNPEKLSTRVILRDVLTKGTTDAEIRKVISRKIDAQKRTVKKNKIKDIMSQLEAFFTEKKLSDNTKETVIEALRYIGIIKK